MLNPHLDRTLNKYPLHSTLTYDALMFVSFPPLLLLVSLYTSSVYLAARLEMYLFTKKHLNFKYVDTLNVFLKKVWRGDSWGGGGNDSNFG